MLEHTPAGRLPAHRLLTLHVPAEQTMLLPYLLCLWFCLCFFFLCVLWCLCILCSPSIILARVCLLCAPVTCCHCPGYSPLPVLALHVGIAYAIYNQFGQHAY